MDEDMKVADSRMTSRFMTKYERARILGTRALQIRFVVVVKKKKKTFSNQKANNKN